MSISLGDYPRAISRRIRRHSRHFKFLQNMSVRSKLLLMPLVISVLSIAVVAGVAFVNGRSELRQAAFSRLTQARSSQGQEVEAEYKNMRSVAKIYSQSETARNAMDGFSVAFDQLNNSIITPEQWQSIVSYYSKNFGNKLDSSGNKIDIEALLPTGNAARFLQANYTVKTQGGSSEHVAEGSQEGLIWPALNMRFKNSTKNLADQFSFNDIIMFDRKGNVIFSVKDGPDLGTNIFSGPYRGQVKLRTAYEQALNSNAVDYVGTADFAEYNPGGAPVAWLVAPVGPPGRAQGVLAFQVTVSVMDKILSAGKTWEKSGMGKTGESAVIGADGYLRTDTRLFLTDPQAYRESVINSGTPAEVADLAIRRGTNAMLQAVHSSAVKAIERGESGTDFVTDYHGHKTMQSYSPLDMPGVNWGIVSKIDADEAFESMNNFTRMLLMASVVIILCACFIGMAWSQILLRPINRLREGTERVGCGDYTVVLPVESPDEFGQLSEAFNTMSNNLLVKETLIAEKDQENHKLMQALMPDSLIKKYKSGGKVVVQDHQEVSIYIADITGLEKTLDGMSPDDSFDVINSLIFRFDAVAESLGVEFLRSSNKGYTATCGLNIPRLDCVSRILDFAIETAEVIERFNKEHGYDLQLRAGIDAGTATSGLVGQGGLRYDLWGSAVSLAYRIREVSNKPGIYVTDRIYASAHDLYQFRQVSSSNDLEGQDSVYQLVGRAE